MCTTPVGLFEKYTRFVKLNIRVVLPRAISTFRGRKPSYFPTFRATQRWKNNAYSWYFCVFGKSLKYRTGGMKNEGACSVLFVVRTGSCIQHPVPTSSAKCSCNLNAIGGPLISTTQDQHWAVSTDITGEPIVRVLCCCIKSEKLNTTNFMLCCLLAYWKTTVGNRASVLLGSDVR